MIEFALAFVFLVPVFLGSYSFGHAFYVYNGLQSAVRGGARFASLQTYNSGTSTPSEAFAAAVRNVVVYGDPDGGTTPIAPGLTAEDVTVEVTFESGIPRWVTVGIASYQENAAVRMLDFNTKPRLTVTYTGRWDPLN